MYDLSNVDRDFPWAEEGGWDEAKEMWAMYLEEHGLTEEDLEGCVGGWAALPPGWGDIVHTYLERLDELVGRNEWVVHTEQVKEKFGSMRWYYDIVGPDGGELPYGGPGSDTSRFARLARDLQDETSRICCYCGLREGVRRRGSFGRNEWIHFACPERERRAIRRRREIEAQRARGTDGRDGDDGAAAVPVE